MNHLITMINIMFLHQSKKILSIILYYNIAFSFNSDKIIMYFHIKRNTRLCIVALKVVQDYIFKHIYNKVHNIHILYICNIFIDRLFSVYKNNVFIGMFACKIKIKVAIAEA